MAEQNEKKFDKQDDKKKGYTLKALREVNSIAFKANKKAYIAYALLGILMAGNTFVSLASAQYTINSAYNLIVKKADFNSVVIGISLFAASSLAFLVIGMGQRMAENKLMFDVAYSFEKNLNSKLSSIKWDYYESHDAYIKIHEVRTKTLEAIKNMIKSTMTYIATIPLIIIFGYYLLQINIFAVVIYAIMVVVFNRASGKMFGSIGKLWEEVQPYSQRQGYFLGMCGDKNTHQEFKFNRLYGYTSAKWEKLFNSEYKLRLKIFKKHEITLQTARIIFNIPYIVMLIVVAYEIAMGKHEIGFLFMANQLFNNILDTFMEAQDNIVRNRTDSKFVKTYDEICSFEEVLVFKGEQVSGDINLSDVTFSYPQSNYKALAGLNFTIKQGEKIAVAGVNGSGKTTCTNILMALTDRFDGDVTVGGKKASLANSVSCILQDFAQYQMTVRENIESGNPQKKFTEEEIMALLDRVGLKKAVLALEKGIDTPLGQLEKGIELSKGQWQRLAVARLLANQNATVWILDEPTAYLDPLSEIEIYNMIYEFAENRTVFFISHRLGFAKRADRIVLFANGKITEQGTHDELLESGGLYARMYHNQESWYAEKPDNINHCQQ